MPVSLKKAASSTSDPVHPVPAVSLNICHHTTTILKEVGVLWFFSLRVLLVLNSW